MNGRPMERGDAEHHHVVTIEITPLIMLNASSVLIVQTCPNKAMFLNKYLKYSRTKH